MCDITAMQYGILLKYYTKAEIMLMERGRGGIGEHREGGGGVGEHREGGEG